MMLGAPHAMHDTRFQIAEVPSHHAYAIKRAGPRVEHNIGRWTASTGTAPCLPGAQNRQGLVLHALLHIVANDTQPACTFFDTVAVTSRALPWLCPRGFLSQLSL